MSNLQAKIQSRAVATTSGKGRATLRDIVIAEKDRIQEALPKHVDADRFVHIILTELRKNPKLMECTRQSFLGALSVVSQLGLEVGSARGHAYLIPFRNNKQGIVECTLIIGYQGMIELARRAGAHVVARDICEGDEFSMDYGTEMVTHKPSLKRGKPLAYYAIARWALPDGTEHQFVHMLTLDEIARRRERSKAKNEGPWVTDEEAMSKKSVVRAMWPYLPKSSEDMSLAYQVEDNVVHAEAIGSDYIDVEVIGDDELTPLAPVPEPKPEPQAEKVAQPEAAPAAPAAPEGPTPAQLKRLYALLRAAAIEKDNYHEFATSILIAGELRNEEAGIISSFNDLSQGELNAIYAYLEGR